MYTDEGISAGVEGTIDAANGLLIAQYKRGDELGINCAKTACFEDLPGVATEHMKQSL